MEDAVELQLAVTYQDVLTRLLHLCSKHQVTLVHTTDGLHHLRQLAGHQGLDRHLYCRLRPKFERDHDVGIESVCVADCCGFGDGLIDALDND